MAVTLRKPQTVTQIQKGLIEHHRRCGNDWSKCKCDLAKALRALQRYLWEHDPKNTGRV